jgi:hypothetical protein
MKTIKKYSVLIALGLIAFSGCKKLDEVNTNPNAPGSVTPSVQLTATELQIGYTIGGDFSRYVGVIDQHVVGYDRQLSVAEQYVFSPSDFDQAWQNMYLSMANLQDLYSNSAKAGYNEYAGIARVLMAYCLGSSTDVWGDIPYKEALKGFDNLTPAFDNQQDVYGSIQSLLDTSIYYLNLTPGSKVPSADDIVYAGDGGKWLRLAYSLKARYYLHIRKRDNTALTKAAAAAANGFTASSDDAYFNFGTTSKSANPWYQFFQQRGSDAVFFVDLNPDVADTLGTAGKIMANTGDPRLPFLIDVASGGLGSANSSPQSGIQLMTYAELNFINSEIALLGGDASGAATSYNTGVAESVTAITGSAPSGSWAATYANETGGSISLSKIMTQKYIALFLNPEAFSDWRRTGFPALSLNPGAVTTTVPRRLLYPETELERNAAHCPSLVRVTDQVWWDN